MAVATEAEPLYISVAEAARLLGISRTHAYDQAHLGIETAGAKGLPAIRLGRRILVRRPDASWPGQQAPDCSA